MKIKIYGPGCPKCKQLEANTKKALSELGKEADIEKVTDMGKIIEAGIIMTPALEINGKIVSSGKLLETDEIEKLVK